jgi:hypothetical protein
MIDDLTSFITDHRLHGSMTADATERNGYLMTVACPCGVEVDHAGTSERRPAPAMSTWSRLQQFANWFRHGRPL